MQGIAFASITVLLAVSAVANFLQWLFYDDRVRTIKALESTNAVNETYLANSVKEVDRVKAELSELRGIEYSFKELQKKYITLRAAVLEFKNRIEDVGEATGLDE